MEPLVQACVGFVTLLLFPFLALLGLLRRRAAPWLALAVLGWLALGVLALGAPWRLTLPRERFLHSWLTGLALGAAFLLVLWLRSRRPIKRWLRTLMALLTITVFCKALFDFMHLYAP